MAARVGSPLHDAFALDAAGVFQGAVTLAKLRAGGVGEAARAPVIIAEATAHGRYASGFSANRALHHAEQK